MNKIMTKRTLLLAARRWAASGTNFDPTRPAIGSVVVLPAMGTFRLVEGEPQQMSIIAFILFSVDILVRQV